MADKPTPLTKDQLEYIEWLVLDKATRVANGLPTSQREWCQARGVSDRSTRRWADSPSFNAALEKRKNQISSRAKHGSTVGNAEATLPGNDDGTDYLAIKATLAAAARAGEKGAAETWLKTFGKTFIDEEAASRITDLATLDDTALVAELCSSAEPDELAEYLRALGWTVTAPLEPTDAQA